MKLLRWLRSGWGTHGGAAGLSAMRAGGILLVLAIGFAGHSWVWARHRVRAEATVVENLSGFAAGGGVVYSPRVRFRGPDGEIVQVVSGPAEREAAFGPGEVVRVLYLAGDPQSAVIATTYRLYFWAIWLGIVGTVLFDVGLVVRRLAAA